MSVITDMSLFTGDPDPAESLHITDISLIAGDPDPAKVEVPDPSMGHF